jgi:hypothetical protein
VNVIKWFDYVFKISEMKMHHKLKAQSADYVTAMITPDSQLRLQALIALTSAYFQRMNVKLCCTGLNWSHGREIRILSGD